MIKTVEAVFLIVSTVVGLGVFFLPSALAQSGIYFWLWFIFLILSIYLLHLAYGEIIFQARAKHNLPGLAARFLTPRLKLPVWLFDFVGFQLILFAYFIALSKFVPLIYPLPPLAIKSVVFVSAALITYFSINPLAKIESVLSLILIALFLAIGMYLLPNVDFTHFSSTFNLPQLNPIYSYGLLIFALTGYSALPLVYDLVGRSSRLFKKVSAVALIIIFLLYALFTLTVVGVLGRSVSEDSLSSLVAVLTPNLVKAVVVLAVINIITTFFSLAFYLKRGLIEDFRFAPKQAWFLTNLPGLFFVFVSIERLASLASLIGGLFLAVNLMILLLCYSRLQTIAHFKISKPIIWLLLLLFGLGWLAGLFFE